MQSRAADLLEVDAAGGELRQQRGVALVQPQRSSEQLAVLPADGLRHRRRDLLRCGSVRRH